MATLNDAQKKLIEGKNFGHVATLNPDGSPQVTPVWIRLDGDGIAFNSEKSRKKVKNLERDARVAISVADSANAYSYIEIRGKVVEITEKGANDDIDALAMKYMGKEKYPFHKPGDVRVVIRIAIEKVSGMV